MATDGIPMLPGGRGLPAKTVGDHQAGSRRRVALWRVARLGRDLVVTRSFMPTDPSHWVGGCCRRSLPQLPTWLVISSPWRNGGRRTVPISRAKRLGGRF